jgi:hypothetical protein
MSRLAAIYAELHRNAERTGEARSTGLSGGARLTVRVREGHTTLTIARRGKRVGDREIVTFRRDCGVPASAERRPKEGQKTLQHQGATWWYVAFRWSEQPSNTSSKE